MKQQDNRSTNKEDQYICLRCQAEEMSLEELEERVRELLEQYHPTCHCCGKPVTLPDSGYRSDEDKREYLTALFVSFADDTSEGSAHE